MRALLVGGPLDGQERALSEKQRALEERDYVYHLDNWTGEKDEPDENIVMYVHNSLSQQQAAKLVLQRRKEEKGAGS